MKWPSTDIPVKPVGSLLDDAVARFGSSPAMDFLGRRWSYSELGDLVARAAVGFRLLGVRKGVRVGLCLPNSPYFIISYYAVLKAGGTVVNFNPLYVEREMAHQVDDSGTSIMVTLDQQQLYPKVAALLGRSSLQQVVVCPLADILPPPLVNPNDRAEIPDLPNIASFETLTSYGNRFVPEAIDPESAVAVLQYTGGTTGVPKGAVLTHANLTANVAQMHHLFGPTRPGEERVFCVLPLFHVFAMTVAMNLGISLGAELILLPRFEVELAIKTIARTKPTLFPGVPTIFTAINGAARTSVPDLSSLRFCISGGAPLPLEVRKEFERLSGCRLVEGYGLSEASPVVTFNPIDGIDKDGSIGLPILGTDVEIRSTMEPEKVLGVNETGELWVRGPQVMAGYWQRPEDTAAVLTDGALRTGDVGYRDADGYIFLVDRIKDLIICSGYNVYPRVIEEALYRHPAVAEAVVIGIPDAYRGQAPKAFVRLRDEALTIGEAELLAFLGEQLSRLEVPKSIEFRSHLPKTSVGKLSKKELLVEELARISAASKATPS